MPEADQRQVQKLKQREREVRAHEHAPMAAAAGIVQEKIKVERQEAENKDEA